MWYVIENEERRGPFSLSQIRGQRAAFLLSADSVIENGLGQRVLVDDYLPEFRPGPLVAPVRLAPPHPSVPANRLPVQTNVPLPRSPFVSEPQPIEVLDLPREENQAAPVALIDSSPASPMPLIPAPSAVAVTPRTAPVRNPPPTATAPWNEPHPPSTKIGDWEFVSTILCASFSIATVIALTVVFAAGPRGGEVQFWGVIFSLFSGGAAVLSFLVSRLIKQVVALEETVTVLRAELNRLRRHRSRDDDVVI